MCDLAYLVPSTQQYVTFNRIVLSTLESDGNKEDIDAQEDIQNSPDDLSDETDANLTENADANHQGSSEDLLNDDEDIPLEIGEMSTNMFFDAVTVVIISIVIIIIVVKVIYQRALQPRIPLRSRSRALFHFQMRQITVVRGGEGRGVEKRTTGFH